VYHFTKVQDNAYQLEEVYIKVFVSRQNPQIPSIFWIWKSANFQERESYDMLGITHEIHPCLKRILMRDSWVNNMYGIQSGVIDNKVNNTLKSNFQHLFHIMCGTSIELIKWHNITSLLHFSFVLIDSIS